MLCHSYHLSPLIIELFERAPATARHCRAPRYSNGFSSLEGRTRRASRLTKKSNHRVGDVLVFFDLPQNPASYDSCKACVRETHCLAGPVYFRKPGLCDNIYSPRTKFGSLEAFSPYCTDRVSMRMSPQFPDA